MAKPNTVLNFQTNRRRNTTLLLLPKTKSYDAYVLKEKASVSGHVRVGKTRLMCYALFFFGILSVEAAILAIQYFFQAQTPSLAVSYLIPITACSAGRFLAEGLTLWRRIKPPNHKDELLEEKISQS